MLVTFVAFAFFSTLLLHASTTVALPLSPDALLSRNGPHELCFLKRAAEAKPKPQGIAEDVVERAAEPRPQGIAEDVVKIKRAHGLYLLKRAAEPEAQGIAEDVVERATQTKWQGIAEDVVKKDGIVVGVGVGVGVGLVPPNNGPPKVPDGDFC